VSYSVHIETSFVQSTIDHLITPFLRKSTQSPLKDTIFFPSFLTYPNHLFQWSESLLVIFITCNMFLMPPLRLWFPSISAAGSTKQFRSEFVNLTFLLHRFLALQIRCC
jgi:hypothetical protein